MLSKSSRRGFFLILVFLLLLTNLFAEHPDSALKKISENKSIFQDAAKRFKIDMATLMSVVFVERTLNFDWKDDALDITLAMSGYNSSIGFCQVKMKTAYWIEVQFTDTTSEFNPEKEYQNLLSLSKTPKEIITKLQNDSLNIQYASAYLKIIQNYWQKKGYHINDRPDIIGTLYSTGLFLPHGEIRKPNSNPKANTFGKKTLEAYNLFNEIK